MTATDDDTATRHRPLLVVAGVVLAAALAAGAVVWLRSVEWPIEVVRFDGETRYSDRDDMRRIVSAHVRDGFFGTDLGALRRDLVDLPWVRDAALRRVWPDRLDVEIDEHRAAAVWNEDRLVSRAGTVFGPDEFDATDLPRLQGPEGTAGTMLRRLHRFRLQLASVGVEIDRLHQDDRRSWSVALADGMKLRLGRERVDPRLERLVAVWWLAIAGERQRIRSVDLRYPNGFAIAWRRSSDDTPEGGA